MPFPNEVSCPVPVPPKKLRFIQRNLRFLPFFCGEKKGKERHLQKRSFWKELLDSRLGTGGRRLLTPLGGSRFFGAVLFLFILFFLRKKERRKKERRFLRKKGIQNRRFLALL
jgi:hypothetical protein